ncbi:unnamed protein product, partial [marine sediment metagenome]
MVAGVAAAVVGVALTLAGRCEYRCAATIRLTGDVSAAQYATYRKDLRDYAWDRASDSTEAHLGPRRWSVDSPGPALLRFSLTANDRQAGVQRARVIAEGYRDEMRAKAANARATPTEAEDILAEYVARLQTRLNETQTRVGAAVAALPDTASEHLKSVMTQWKALRADFDTAREQLNRATVDLTRLRSEPEPTHGIVSSEVRGEARRADKALQQDLRELAVNLTELKLHLLNVWQQSAGPLERLVLSANELIETASDQPRVQRAGPDDARDVAPVAAAA